MPDDQIKGRTLELITTLSALGLVIQLLVCDRDSKCEPRNSLIWLCVVIVLQLATHVIRLATMLKSRRRVGSTSRGPTNASSFKRYYRETAIAGKPSECRTQVLYGSNPHARAERTTCYQAELGLVCNLYCI